MITKIVYQVNNNGLYLGPATAYESPSEPGVFHIPAGCVETAPPALEADQVGVWSGDGWTIVVDHRGEVWFDGRSPVVIDFVGNPAERGYAVSAPEIPMSLDQYRSAAKFDIDAAAEAYRLAYITGGAGQAMIYQQKLEEAKAYIANPSLTADECPHIFAEIGITGDTAGEVAEVVTSANNAWQVKSSDIEHKRLAAKAAVKAAETVEAISLAARVLWDA